MSWEERDADAALRADVRRVTTLLGAVPRAPGGPPSSSTSSSRSGPSAATTRPRPTSFLRTVDAHDAARLVRAFSAYFHLANVVEQVHRGRELRRRRAVDGGWLERTARAIAERGVPTAELEAIADTLDVRPVLTAHPTEAARRSTLTKLRAVADVLDAEAAEAARCSRVWTSPSARTASWPRSSTLLWLTDELRRERPEPIDEARNVMFHLEDAARVAVPAVLRRSGAVFARFGVELPVDAVPLRFGTWTGGDRDGNPNVTAGGDDAGADVCSTSWASGSSSDRWRRSSRSSASRRASAACPTSCSPPWPRTSSACPRSTPASAGSTPRSPTG